MPEEKRRALPYEGNEPYIFLSYSHAEKGMALLMVEMLNRKGYRVYYDYGKKRTKEVSEGYLERIKKADIFILLVSKHSAESYNVRNEVRCLSENTEVIAVQKEKAVLDPELNHYLKDAKWVYAKRKPLFKKVSTVDTVKYMVNSVSKLLPVRVSEN